MPKYQSTKHIDKTEGIEMFNAVKAHLGISEFRFKHYSLYNEWTSKKRDFLTEPMFNRLVDLYYYIIPSTKKEIPYNENVKREWLTTIENHKKSDEFKKLSDSGKNKIELEIYSLKEMIN